MARAFVLDLWLVKKDAEGRPVPSAVKRKLAAARDPFGASIPEKWKTDRFGRGMRWRVAWSVEEDGKRQRMTKAFEKFGDAEAYRAALEDDLRANKYVRPVEPHLFSEAAKGWANSRKNTVKDSTWYKTYGDLRRYVLPVFRDDPLQTITRNKVNTWVNDLTEKLSPSAVKAAVSAGRGVMAWAIKTGWRTGENPFSETNAPKVSKVFEGRLIFLTPEEVDRLANAASDIGTITDGFLVRFLALTGVRIGEATAVQVGNVDLVNRRILISKTWSLSKTGSSVIGLPKAGRSRKIAYPPELDEEMRKLTEGRSEDEWLFTAPRGGHVVAANWRARVWRPAVKEAELKDSDATPHALRHTYASWAIAAGADVKMLQNQLGHAKAAMTLDTYASLWPDQLDEVSSVVGKMFSDRISKAAEESDQKTVEKA